MPRGRAATLLRLVTSTLATLPTFRELPFDFFTAGGAVPRLLHRFKRRQCLFKDGLRFGVPLIIDDPELWPAFDHRQLTCRSREINILDDAIDAEGRQDISQMADHQRVFGGENSAHGFLFTRNQPCRKTRSFNLSFLPSHKERSR
jgi:hypothetical protein